MRFTDNCWLEINDITGTILFSGIQKKDKILIFSGIAPYNLKISSPLVLKIQYQNKNIDLNYLEKKNKITQLRLSIK